MCFLCDGGTPDELVRLIAAHIDDPGWHIAGVESERGRPGWAYTIGLLERFGHPELVINPFCCWRCAMSVLNGIGNQIAEGSRFVAGDEIRDRDGPGRARVGEVHQRQWQTSRFATWLAYYDGKPWAPEPAALQVITLDQSGRWQDDPGRRGWRFERLDRSPLARCR